MQCKRREQGYDDVADHGHRGGGAQRRPQRLTRSVSAAESGDRDAAEPGRAAAAGSAAELTAADADAVSSSSGEFVEIKARRNGDRMANGAAAQAAGEGVARVSIGSDAVANGLKRRRSARLHSSQEDAVAQDRPPEDGYEDGKPAARKRSRSDPAPLPSPAAISLHDSGSVHETSVSESASDDGDRTHGDADYAPGSPQAQSPEAASNGGTGKGRRGRSGLGSQRKPARPSQQRGRGPGASQRASPNSAIPSTHVACPICGRSVPKVLPESVLSMTSILTFSLACPCDGMCPSACASLSDFPPWYAS